MRVAAISAAAFAAFGLVACGGGGGGTTSTAAPGSAAPGSAKATPGHGAAFVPGPGPGGGSAASGAGQSGGAGSASPPPLTRASARRAEGRAEAVQAARHRALAKKAGHAAPFLVPTGDNSIPTYGSEASSSQLSEATTSLRSYLQARAAGDWTTACSFMANAVRNQVEALAGGSGAESKGCPDAYAKLSERVPASQRASPLTSGLAALRVEGDKAFALFYGPHEQQYMMPMVSEGGAWKVNQIEAVPWPLGTTAGG